MALYFGRRSSADESKLYKDEPKRWINENRQIFRSDFFFWEGGEFESKQEVVKVIEPTGDF